MIASKTLWKRRLICKLDPPRLRSQSRDRMPCYLVISESHRFSLRSCSVSTSDNLCRSSAILPD
ncbi:hypothetical protein B0H19DRAFT_1202139 [Mycena capillaripes]|nr:hypothetical protein B0H19DRAFT_1202139 [Mycena capillaripes]